MDYGSLGYDLVKAAHIVSLVAWILLIVVPAWSSYWRLRERILAVVMSFYILAAFVGMGACAGAVFLYYDGKGTCPSGDTPV